MTRPNYSTLLSGPQAHAVEHYLKSHSYWVRTEPVKSPAGLSWRFTAAIKDGANPPPRYEKPTRCPILYSLRALMGYSGEAK